MRSATPVIERLLPRVVISDVPFNGEPCWIFTGCLSRAGYGRIGERSDVRLTHRVTYEAFVGPIPAGMEIDHLCRQRSCCNPAHLEAVTHATNTRRGLAGEHLRLRRLISVCKQGHPYTPENTYVKANGARRCVECNRTRARAYQQRKRAAA